MRFWCRRCTGKTLINARGEGRGMDEPTARDIMTDGVIAIDANASVREAASQMRDEHIRSLVVLEEGEAVGILVGRDIVYQIVSDGRDPADVAVRDVMTGDLVTAREEDDVEDIARAMVEHDISRVPILRGENLVGIVTHTDLVRSWPSYIDLLEEEAKLFEGQEGVAEEGRTFSGTCDACENYSDDLVQIDGEALCPTCRAEGV